jgi:hypothetical protein
VIDTTDSQPTRHTSEASQMPPTIASDDFVEIQYISVGANRHPASADSTDNLLVFGAGRNIALWNPAVSCATVANLARLNPASIGPISLRNKGIDTRSSGHRHRDQDSPL